MNFQLSTRRCECDGKNCWRWVCGIADTVANESDRVVPGPFEYLQLCWIVAITKRPLSISVDSSLACTISWHHLVHCNSDTFTSLCFEAVDTAEWRWRKRKEWKMWNFVESTKSYSRAFRFPGKQKFHLLKFSEFNNRLTSCWKCHFVRNGKRFYFPWTEPDHDVRSPLSCWQIFDCNSNRFHRLAIHPDWNRQTRSWFWSSMACE